MALSLYAQTQQPDLQCPATDGGARDNTGLCQVYMSAGGKVLCDRSPPGTTGRRFLNTNGFASSDGPLTQGTHLKTADVNSPTGGGCWAQGSNLEVGISPCKFLDSSQKLYVCSPLLLYLQPPTLSHPSSFTNPDHPRCRNTRE